MINIKVKSLEGKLEKIPKIEMTRDDNILKIKIPNIFILLSKDQDACGIDLDIKYKNHENKYLFWFEKETNIIKKDNKIIWHLDYYDGDIENKYNIKPILDKIYCICSNKKNIWILHISFLIDDIKEYYDIWHIIDYYDLDKEDIIYNKITNLPIELLKDTYKKADEYIKNNKQKSFTYYNKLYIIKNGDDIKTFEDDEYYDFNQSIEKKQNNLCIYYIYFFLYFLIIYFLFFV